MFGKFSGKRRTAGEPVYLNVYDLTPMNGYTYWFGLGVYHSGLQVHGMEYAYGAHDNSTTGIFESEPKQCPGFSFRKSILIGRTDLGRREVRALLESMALEFSGDTYNLITKNCNHFCNEASLRLTGKCIPKWVNRLAKIGFFCKCVLPSQVAAVGRRAETIGNSNGRDKEKWKLWSRSVRVPATNPGEVPDDSSANISLPVTTISSRDSIAERDRRMRRSASVPSVNGISRPP